MGLPFAVGVAMALKRKQLSAKVYCVIGDGECDEGSIWEAAMCAAHYHLDNLVVIVDKNGLQYDGSTEAVMNTLSLKINSLLLDLRHKKLMDIQNRILSLHSMDFKKKTNRKL